jgi:WD40 repeat protein
LCVFQHLDFVTAIAFLPKDDRYFLSGSLDGKLRLWHIPDKKVALWNEVRVGSRNLNILQFAGGRRPIDNGVDNREKRQIRGCWHI